MLKSFKINQEIISKSCKGNVKRVYIIKKPANPEA